MNFITKAVSATSILLLFLSFNLNANTIDTLGQPTIVMQLDTILCPGEILDGMYTEPGTYIDTISNSAGLCDSLITITNLEFYTPTPDVITNQTVCEGDAGTYIQVTIDQNGCEYDNILNLTVQASLPDVIFDYQICEGDSVIWNDQIIREFGTYQVELVDANGCPFFEILNLSEASAEDCLSSNKTLYNNLDIRLYPNPAADYLNIEDLGSILGSLHIELINAQGQVIYSYFTKNSKLQIDLSTMPAGMYVAKINSEKNKNIKSIPFVKE